MPTKIDKVMERIRLLLARADHPNTPPAEAELARERAERLMSQHRIEEASLSAEERAAQGIKPQDMHWWVVPVHSEFFNHYFSMAYYISQHVGAQVEWQYQQRDGDNWLVGHAFGFESDLRYGAMLINSVTAAFGERLEPKPDITLGDAENIWRMRNAGMERNRIARILWDAPLDDGRAHDKVTRIFKQEAKRRGENVSNRTGKHVNAKTYRMSYADSFISEINSRLWRMRQSSGGTEIVLQSRREEVLEAFYAAYPARRPQPTAGSRGSSEDTECARCKRAKSGYCRQHAYRRPRRMTGRRYNMAAVEQGRAAARAVDLGGATSNRLPH